MSSQQAALSEVFGLKKPFSVLSAKILKWEACFFSPYFFIYLVPEIVATELKNSRFRGKKRVSHSFKILLFHGYATAGKKRSTSHLVQVVQV